MNATIAAEPTDAAGPKHPGRRRWATRGLVILAALLLVIGALGVWIQRVVLDTPTWTDTSGKALQDPVVQQALSTYLVDQLYDNVDVTAQVQAVLPDAAKPLAAPVAAGLREFADRAALRALDSPRVQTLWATANEQASRAMIKTIEGGGPNVSTANGEVTLNLQPLTDQIANRTGIGSRARERDSAGHRADRPAAVEPAEDRAERGQRPARDRRRRDRARRADPGARRVARTRPPLGGADGGVRVHRRGARH